MSEELKQEIIVTVTESDFKRHNPDIEIDEMRLHNFAEQLMRVVQAGLGSLKEWYHTSISTYPPQPAPSPWIPVTPETMPEVGEWVIITDGIAWIKAKLVDASKNLWLGPSSEFEEKITHYMPTPELPKGSK